jgi:hypothetical protein
MQGIENGHSIRIQPDHFGIDDSGTVNAACVPDDQRVALGSVCAVDCIEPHATILHMDLEPIAVMLQFVRPTRPGGRLLADNWLARMNESGRRV